jgi:hypothetical protein
MKLAAVSVVTALLAAPLAAQAAAPPARWAVTLSGRVVETYSYNESERQEECVRSRIGTSMRELRVASVAPTVVTVTRAGARATYTPPRLRRVQLRQSVGKGSWSEFLRCLGDPISRGSGSCDARSVPRRTLRPIFVWGGANRIVFRGSVAAAPLRLCGLDRTIGATDAWLNMAPGRVDEDALLARRARRVVARAELTRDANLPGEPSTTSIHQRIRVVWTLWFRRLS